MRCWFPSMPYPPSCRSEMINDTQLYSVSWTLRQGPGWDSPSGNSQFQGTSCPWASLTCPGTRRAGDLSLPSLPGETSEEARPGLRRISRGPGTTRWRSERTVACNGQCGSKKLSSGRPGLWGILFFLVLSEEQRAEGPHWDKHAPWSLCPLRKQWHPARPGAESWTHRPGPRPGLALESLGGLRWALPLPLAVCRGQVSCSIFAGFWPKSNSWLNHAGAVPPWGSYLSFESLRFLVAWGNNDPHRPVPWSLNQVGVQRSVSPRWAWAGTFIITPMINPCAFPIPTPGPDVLASHCC